MRMPRLESLFGLRRNQLGFHATLHLGDLLVDECVWNIWVWGRRRGGKPALLYSRFRWNGEATVEVDLK